MSEDIKPCPFCGKPPAVYSFPGSRGFAGRVAIVCSNGDCYAQPEMQAAKEDEVKAAWNKRFA